MKYVLTHSLEMSCFGVLLSLGVWLILVLFWGQFWRSSEQFEAEKIDLKINQGLAARHGASDREGDGVNEGGSNATRSPALPAVNTDCAESSLLATSSPAFFSLPSLPSVTIVIPARNEADVLPRSLLSVLRQTYTGAWRVVLVDDGSTDNTAALARQIANAVASETGLEVSGSEVPLTELRSTQSTFTPTQLDIISPPPLPTGWTGKLWALHHGVEYARRTYGDSDYIWLTDADIEHPVDNLSRLVQFAQADRRELVSLMVQLRCTSFWERLLVPAFIFFFQKLYPFPWVNDPRRSTGAAAGGCVLLATAALDRIGGIAALRDALIDDCTLGYLVKHAPIKHAPIKQTPQNHAPENPPIAPQPYRRIWLGLSHKTRSLREYATLQSLWEMVARTAYTQLNYSPLLLLGTVFGMGLVYLLPPIAALGGILSHHLELATLGGLTWGLMVIAYRPTLRWYGQPSLGGVVLPAIAGLYLLMTLDSARRHWLGQGGAWKGRTY